MKILHIAQIVAGGVASYLEEVVPWQQAELGSAKVRVLVPADQSRHLAALPKDILTTFPSSRRTPGNLLRFAAKARETIRRERPDLIHLHSSFAGAIVRGLLLLSPAPRPKIVYCAHGWAFGMRARRARATLYAALERRLQAVTDLIVCISDDEFERARRHGIDERKMIVIRNGIARDAPDPRPLPSLDPAKMNLLFVGRLAPQKGLPTLLEAMDRLAGTAFHLHVVGADVAAGYWTSASPRGNVSFHGWQPRAAVQAYIAACDALVVPSRWEGFGLVAIEAMRLGRAVLASRVDALPELVEEGGTGLLFEPDDPAELAALIAGLDRRRLAALGRAGRDRFLSRYTGETMNRSLMDAYRRLTSDGR